MFEAILSRNPRLAIIALALLAGVHGGAGTAHQLPVIAYVANENASVERSAAFKKGLTDLGYVEGTNLRIEYRYAKLDREYDAVMAELVSRNVNVIVAGNAAAASAAAKATRTIPIVLAAVNDPVGLGVADSLQHPGRNVSGTTIYAPHLIGERLGMLKRIDPSLDRVAIFMNGNNMNNAAQVELLTAAAKPMGIKVDSMDIRSPADVEPSVNKAIASGAKGFFNCVDTFINSQRFTIAKLAARNKIPTVYTDEEYVLGGGLMNQVHPNAVKSELDALTVKFFRAVSFEAGEVPSYDEIYTIFIEAGLLIKNTASAPEISSVRQFIAPRKALVASGELTRFREWELSESSQIFGNVAHRFSAYAKSGTTKGSPFETRGMRSTRTPTGEHSACRRSPVSLVR